MLVAIFISTSFLFAVVSETGSVTNDRKNDPENPKVFSWLPAWRESKDCGRIAAWFVADYEGVGSLDFERVVQLLPIQQDGLSIGEIESFLKAIGLNKYRARWVRPSEVGRVRCPAIVHIQTEKNNENGHFLVLLSYANEGDSYKVLDTESGKVIEVSGRAFRKATTGYVVDASKKSWWDWRLIMTLFFGFVFGSVLFYARANLNVSHRFAKFFWEN